MSSGEEAPSPQGESSAKAPSNRSGESPRDETRPRILRSKDILDGHPEVWIEHGDEMYRLRVTAAGKLYLTK